tara:strand:- start:290 stop:448 length:159 start_codon:yes stop_codon:yes gene_type:complete
MSKMAWESAKKEMARLKRIDEIRYILTNDISEYIFLLDEYVFLVNQTQRRHK